MGISLILVRHEDAEPGPQLPDAHRGLTAFGRRRMRSTAALFAQHEHLDVIFTSPLVRAVQTAEIFAGVLAFDEPIRARSVVAEPDSVDEFLSVLDELHGERRVAIVGHEPTMSTVVSELLGRRFSRSFAKGMIVALDYTKSATKFRFLIDPAGPTRVDAI